MAGASDERVAELAREVIEACGLELVEFSLRGSRGSRLLRVDIDRPGPAGVGHDDCQRVSRELGARLDELDAIDGHYCLEVSSPGIDRPIRTADDLRRNVGRRVVVTLARREGRSAATSGLLVGADESCVRLAVEGSPGEIRIPREAIQGIVQDWKR